MRAIICSIALVGGLLLSQAPEFMQQYQQRLGGTKDELAKIVRHFEDDSRRSGYDRNEALRLMAKNPERLIRDQSGRMAENIARLSRIEEHQMAMRELSGFARLATFLSTYDSEVVGRTFQSYVGALPLSFDGILFAAVGFGASYTVLFVLALVMLRRRGVAA
jgi:hypothetical protein